MLYPALLRYSISWSGHIPIIAALMIYHVPRRAGTLQNNPCTQLDTLEIDPKLQSGSRISPSSIAALTRFVHPKTPRQRLLWLSVIRTGSSPPLSMIVLYSTFHTRKAILSTPQIGYQCTITHLSINLLSAISQYSIELGIES